MNSAIISFFVSELISLMVVTAIITAIFGAIVGTFASNKYTTYQERFWHRLPVTSCIACVFALLSKLMREEIIYGQAVLFWQALNYTGWGYVAMMFVIDLLVAFNFTKWLARLKGYWCECESGSKCNITTYKIGGAADDVLRNKASKNNNHEAQNNCIARAKLNDKTKSPGYEELASRPVKTTKKKSINDKHTLQVVKIRYMTEDLPINIPMFQTVEKFYEELASIDVGWVNQQMYDAAAGIFIAIVFAAPLYECSDLNDKDSLINCFWETMPSYSDKFKKKLVEEDLVGKLHVLQNKDDYTSSELYEVLNALVDMIWAIYFERCPRVKNIPHFDTVGVLYLESFVNYFNMGEKAWRQVFPEASWPNDDK